VSREKTIEERIHRMALRTWNIIANDVFRCMEEAGEKTELPKGQVVETVCDADYMLTNGGDEEAYREWQKMSYEEKTKVVADAFPYQTYM